MLRTTWHNSIRTPVLSHIRREDLVAKLHDHGFLITMSPIVYRYEETGRDRNQVRYDIWETVNVLPFGLWKQDVNFSAAFEDTADGVMSELQAPMGVTSHARYSVVLRESMEEDGGGGGGGGVEQWVLNEEIESSCSVFLRTFVEWTMVATRKKMHASIMDGVKR